jgi:hypothetical protein
LQQQGWQEASKGIEICGQLEALKNEWKMMWE